MRLEKLFLSAVALAAVWPAALSCVAREGFETGEVRRIGEEAIVYGLPLVMNYAAMYESFVDRGSSQYKCPFNELYNTARVYTPRDTAIVTPNSDTPYSFFGGDLRAEPLVFTVPEIEAGRYFSVQLIDWYTHNFGYVGSRTTGNRAGRYLIAGPSWKGRKPAGIDRVFRSETEFVFAIFRTQLFDTADLEKVKLIQAGYRLQPLSAFLGTPAPTAAPEIAWPRIDKHSAETNPFAYLNFVLQFCPPVGPAKIERPLRDRLSRIGIVAGQPFSAEVLPPERRAELVEGLKAGMESIRSRVAGLGRNENGWRVGAAFGNRSFFRGDWGLRAAAAVAGIYGNNPAEALYPMLSVDADGHPPDGARHRYTLTFAPGELPPAKAFWSVTMYDGRTQLLIDNPIDRYVINSPMLSRLKKNADGSLTLHIRKDSPGSDLESNWLPAPDGPIYLVMRIYWPERSALDGRWHPPALKRVD